MNLDRAAGRVPARGRGVRGAAADARARARAIRWRCRAGGCTRRSRSRCGCTPTARPRSRSTTTWWCRSCRASTSRGPRSRTGGAGKLPTAPLERTLTAHRRAVREHLGRVDALRSELEAEGMATELLDGEQVVHAAVVVLQPDQGRPGPAPGAGRASCSASSTRRSSARRRSRPALRLREAIASSSLDFDRDSHLRVRRPRRRADDRGRDHGGAHARWGGCTAAMLTRQPFTLCVYVHALERRRERQRLKLAYRRLFTINRGAESRGRVPDFDRYVQEREYEGLLGQLATGQQTGLFHVSIYETAPRPRPRPRPERAVRGGRLLRRADRVGRRLQGQRRHVPPAAAVGEHAAARARRARRRCASTRPSTPPTCCRWSGPSAGRRPGSRSRSPTPAAPSSC